MAPLQELFPEKGQMGSLLNSFDLTVKERLIGLRNYMQQLQQLPGINQLPQYLDFLDVEHKGISGFRRVMGNSQVLKESYAETSRGNFDFMGVYIWATHYVGLTKRGELYILRTLYDEPNAAVIRIDLRSIDVRVGGDVGTRVIHVMNGDTKVFIKFSTMDDFSSWLRQVSDFGVHTASSAASVGRINAAKNAPKTRDITPVQEQHVRSKGTGNTDDELSVMYGM